MRDQQTNTTESNTACGSELPIILVDGESIVDLMIEKGFGVQIETMSIPSYALDLVLGNDDFAPQGEQASVATPTKKRHKRSP